jgi:hypothetical protein
MKHVRFVNKLVALGLLIGVSLGCEKNLNQQVQPTITPPAASDTRVAQLVERAFQQGSQEEYDAITVAYKGLNFAQLELFNQLKMEADSKKLTQAMATSGGRADEQQVAMVTQQLKQISNFRSKINERSVERYGVPYNQLADSVMNRLLDEEAQNYSFVMPNLDTPADANARLSQPNACTSASFLLLARKVSNGNKGWSGWTERRTPNTSDCDYEFRYSGYRIDFDPKDWFADRLCDSFNNRIARRYASGYTRLLFGNRGVWLWIGYPGLLSVNMADY